jgi:hypothetical protein
MLAIDSLPSRICENFPLALEGLFLNTGDSGGDIKSGGRIEDRYKALSNHLEKLGLDLVDKRAPSLMLLTMSGVQLVLARSEKPEGKAFRRWLVTEVIPAYESAKQVAGAAPPELEDATGPAGASAPELLVQALVTRLRELGVGRVHVLDGIEEHVQFPLPKGLTGS